MNLNARTIFSAVAALVVPVIGCAQAPEPKEEQVVPTFGSKTQTAEASGFFRINCPWGFFYFFCSEADQSKAASEGCDVVQCEPMGSSNCFGGGVREAHYLCEGELVRSEAVPDPSCALAD